MSNSSVNVIFQDSYGVIWIGTWDGLNRYDGRKFSQYHSIINDSTTLSHPVIRNILEEDSIYLWIITDWGVNRFNRRTGLSKRYFLNSLHKAPFAENAFRCTISRQKDIIVCFAGKQLYQYNKTKDTFEQIDTRAIGKSFIKNIRYDRQNMLWVITDNKLLHLSLNKHFLKLTSCIKLPVGTERTVFDNQGKLWVQTAQGLYTLNNGSKLNILPLKLNGKLNRVCYLHKQLAIGTDKGLFLYTNGKHKQQLFNVNVTTLFQGSQNILWVGTDGRGVYQYYMKPEFAKSFSIGQKNMSVRAICMQNNKILVGTKGEGLLVYKANSNDSLQLLNIHDVGPGRTDNAVYSLSNGLDNRVWVGTDGVGLFYWQNGHLEAMKFTSDYDRHQIYSVYAISQVNDSTLYIGTSGNGLIKATIIDNQVKNVCCYNSKRRSTVKNDIVYAVVNANPYLWIGSRGDGLTCLDMRNQQTKNYRNNPRDKHSLASNDIISLYRDSQQRLWIGTTQGLDLMVTKENGSVSFQHIISSDSHAISKNIHSIQEDSFGSIWVSTSNGVIRVQKNLSTTRFTYRDGLQSDEFSDGAGMVTPDKKRIFFGGTNGLSIMYPSLIQSTSFMPRLTLNALYIDGKPQPLANSYQISNGAKTLEFNFSVLDFIDNERCELSYKLIRKHWWSNGKEEDKWISVGNARSITLNELFPGSYILQVRQSNSAHRWSENTLSIPFYVSYPLWCRWWSILLYIIALCWFVRSAYRAKMHRLHTRQQHELEKQSQHNREEIHHAKLRFFANVTSHFSNNITQVFDALENLRNNHCNNESIELNRIEEQIRQMKMHIRQMSEIQSAEDNDTALNVEQVNISLVLRVALDNYSATIMGKNITLLLDDNSLQLTASTDRQLLFKALNNLLTYIIDNIQENSKMEVNAKADEFQAYIAFTYSGVQPDSAEHSDIFNSYKALDKFENNMSEGRSDTTIRLTLTNDLAKRLGGKLTISSPRANMATFVVSLKQQPLPIKSTVQKVQPTSKLERILSHHDQSILLIESDKEMADFINEILQADYNIMACQPEKWSTAVIANSIDLVICDVSDSSFQCIDELRSNAKTMYVPIIAICNEGEKKSIVDSLRTGANSILEKPFHTNLLQAMADRLIQEAARMKSFSNSPNAYIQRYNSIEMSAELRHFIAEAVNTVSQNYTDENYNPDTLAQDMTISRSQLYRKMKQAIDMSPSDFILEYRMQQAERLLRQSTHTISEIITACGFRNRAFFYREFSQRYKCLPKEYRKQNNHTE